ncbi:MAG TPA: RagB/SusD family nutrient uptake outer membrane protein [Gemmatimonadales bacterium]
MHMKINRALGTLVGGAALLFGSACGDLEVTNPNNPDVDRALASPEDVISISSSTLFNWYRSVTHYEPFAALSVNADMHTSNFGNFGMRFANVEPRIAYGNSSAGSDAMVAQRPWQNHYSDLALANSVLAALKGGLSLGGPEEDAKWAALSQFTQAASLTSLAQIFDQAFIVDETSDPYSDAEMVPYTAVRDDAEARWDALIASLATQKATYDASVLPIVTADGEYSLDAGTKVALTSASLSQIANTMAARLLAYTPRTGAENAAANWPKILQYAEKGISMPSNRFDLAIQQDGGQKWFSYVVYYGAEASWLRTDIRLMNVMNPALPAKFTGTIPPQGTSPDARYAGDYRYHGNAIGDPARGIYMQSPFSHKRYAYAARLSPTLVQGPAPYILAAENDLLIAEALIRTGGDLNRAAELINGTRVGRGKLPAATAAEGAVKLLQYVDYERQVELITTGAIEFFDARRFERLQPLAWRHLPVPARELEIIKKEIYTFGGANDPEMRRARESGIALMLARKGVSLNTERPQY